MAEQDNDLPDVIVCAKCQKPTRAARTGTITQWIAGCDCELLAVADETIEVDLCHECGKRINKGRAGSLTQWIFRTDCCTCASPVSKPSIAQKVLAERAAKQAIEDQADRLTQSKTADEDAIRDLARGEFIETTRYEPISRLGSGASGSVFLCRDNLLSRKVALKKLRRTSALTVIDFQSEAQTCSKLKHPNIVSILDLSTDDTGIPYMVMEYVDGITLESHLATNGPFPLARTLKLMDEICDALSYSHNLGIMHRDVKSSNILLSKEHSYLIDFGIAKFKGILTDGELDLSTTDNTMVGSPLYMPPDQGLGFAYDERSEVYSVGCVLFEALTGRTPFSGGSSLQILSQHAHTQAPSLSETAPQLEFPQELEMVVAKCLEKQPDDRFQSISELRTALNQIHLVDEEFSEVESSIDFGDVNLVQAAAGIMPTDVQSHEAGFKRSRVISLAVLLVLVTITGGVASRLFLQDKRLSSAPTQSTTTRKSIPDFNDVDRRDVIRRAVKNGQVKLCFSSGFINDGDLELLKGYTRIEELDLMGNPITDQGLMQVSAPYAKKLVLTNCDVKTLEFVKNFPNLQCLYLEGTNITDESLENVKYLPMLRDLKLSETTISDAGLKYVTAARSLEYVIVHGTRVTKAGAERISQQMPLTAIAPTVPRRIVRMLQVLNSLEASEKYSEAIEQSTKIIDIVERAQGADAPLIVPYLLRRSAFKTHLHRPDSVDDLKKAIVVARSSKNDIMLKSALAALLNAYVLNHLEQEAEPIRLELLATIKRLDGPESTELLQYEKSVSKETTD